MNVTDTNQYICADISPKAASSINMELVRHFAFYKYNTVDRSISRFQKTLMSMLELIATN